MAPLNHKQRSKAVEQTLRSREKHRAKYDAGQAARNARQRALYAAEKVRLYHRGQWPRDIQKKYGLTVEDVARMANAQGLGCAICRRPLRFDNKDTTIDHCHATGRVRGLLCSPCNHALGHAFDSPERLEAMAAYLRRTTCLR